MENALSNARINNNLRPMFVKEIIFEHTDENHFLTVNEILGILQSCYAISSTRKTIYDDINMLIESGFDIECVKGKQGINMYHVLSREFDAVELRVIIDAVKDVKSLPLSKQTALIRKISRLAGPSADLLLQNTIVDRHHNAQNSQIYYIIDAISKAITSRRQIVIKYSEVLSADKPAKHYELQVSPFRLVCCNGAYYLFAYSEQNMKISAFMLDNFREVPTVTNEACVQEPNNIYVDTFREALFCKNNSDDYSLLLEFESSVLDAFTDRFGLDVDYTQINNNLCRAKVIASVDNEFFSWLFGLEGKVRIISPRNIKEQYVRMVSKEMARL